MLEILKARFLVHENLHPNLKWSDVENRRLEAPGAREALRRMERSGGEPDTIGRDAQTRRRIVL